MTAAIPASAVLIARVLCGREKTRGQGAGRDRQRLSAGCTSFNHCRILRKRAHSRTCDWEFGGHIAWLSREIQTLELVEKRLLHFFLESHRKFLALRSQIKRIDRHLSFRIDQGDFNVALLPR